MTLTYALIADGAIIMAADSQVTYSHSDQGRLVAAYKGTKSKIRHLPTASFTIAGNEGLIEYLLSKTSSINLSQPFVNVVLDHSRIFKEAFATMYPDLLSENPPQCDFMFCGFDNGPQIIKLSSNRLFQMVPCSHFAFTGSHEHGGTLYLQHRFYRKGMSLEQSKTLAYCILSEIAESDNTVGGPIEMAVLTIQGQADFGDFSDYEKKRLRVVEAVRHALGEGRDPYGVPWVPDEDTASRRNEINAAWKDGLPRPVFSPKSSDEFQYPWPTAKGPCTGSTPADER